MRDFLDKALESGEVISRATLIRLSKQYMEKYKNDNLAKEAKYFCKYVLAETSNEDVEKLYNEA